MPPLPKKKYPKARQGHRRSHDALRVPSLVACRQCHSPRLPHHVCPVCGNYRGRTAIKLKEARRS